MKPFTKAFPTIAVLAAVTVSAAQPQDFSDAGRQALIENVLQSDTNNDGALYLSEFELLMKRNADDKRGSALIVVRTGAHGRVFKRLDKNSDGAVTRDEIQALAEERR